MKVVISQYGRQSSRFISVGTSVVAMVGVAIAILSACSTQPLPTPVVIASESQTQHEVTVPPDAGSPTEIVIFASDLPESALYEFEFWEDEASPNGIMIGTPNNGGDLDPPPENDPQVTFTVNVHSGVAYRCWIHMKVGVPRGVSQANKLWVQFSDTVDEANQAIFRPDTGSYLTAQGPDEEGWTWVSCDLAGAEPAPTLIHFGIDGEVTVRIQAGMEGVGFDQFLLSSTQFLESPPSHAVIEE